MLENKHCHAIYFFMHYNNYTRQKVIVVKIWVENRIDNDYTQGSNFILEIPEAN